MSTVRPSKSSHGRPFSANRTHPSSPAKTTADGHKYPEIRQRGFYSDILPNETSAHLEVFCYFAIFLRYIGNLLWVGQTLQKFLW